MAPLRSGQARVRPRQPPKKIVSVFPDSEDDEPTAVFDEEPPAKRIRTSRKSVNRARWIPGGRGGGGRHADHLLAEIGAETPRSSDDWVGRRPRAARSTMGPTPRPRSTRRTAVGARHRYSTATAAAAAVAHGDGYKPREERGWEEFHPDLELESAFAVIESEDVDGIVRKPAFASGSENGHISEMDEHDESALTIPRTPRKKKLGRPTGRRADSMLNSLLTPEAPKVVPVPGPNPRERLTLPRPSFREQDPFLTYEQKDIAQVNFVDRTMASVGYQESEIYLRPDRTLIRLLEGSAEEDLDLSPALNTDGENSAIGSTGVGKVEYDMDEQDVKWLEALNKIRNTQDVEAIKPAVFEITMTKIEKEWHALEKRIPKQTPKPPQTHRPRSSSAAAVNGEPGPGEEQDSKCAICDDGDCENANAIVFCDGCDMAVHQECYGVPYIPEGQWLCRKCQLLGKHRPTCIFCPNMEGAFKQANNTKWAHLLCATWIPEVNIGNTSVMEPIVDVEKVPSNRWTLLCYICNQRMGACIQCSDKRCYQAFHPTCARRAGLQLKMKSGQGANSLLDKSQLRPLCDKHVPAEWRLEHDTDTAITEAISYYDKTLKGKKWADPRTSALALEPSDSVNDADSGLQRLVLTNKRGQKQKTIWRLPSGAPVIPEVILRSIEGSLQRFTVRRKKEYVAEVCKYWTLKREARRGAALLKRLQLQMDSFSSFEVTRRNYQAQGAAGRARLDRRIEFAEHLSKDLDRIRAICDLVKQRELEKLQDAAILKDIVDTVYFPIPPLLWPILEKALQLDPKHLFREALLVIRAKLANRSYTSATSFSADLVHVFSSHLGVEASNTAEFQAQVDGRAMNMSFEQKEVRKLAKRIVKAIQPALEEAVRKESELNGRPYAQQMKEMDEMLFSRRVSFTDSMLEEDLGLANPTKLTNGINHSTPSLEHDEADLVMLDRPEDQLPNGHSARPEASDSLLDTSMPDVVDEDGEDLVAAGSIAQLNGELIADAEQTLATHTPPASTNGIKKDASVLQSMHTKKPSPAPEPPTPPLSLADHQQVALVQGGIPWYVEQFDPDGTTIHDERWTGPEVLREMSEELSEMDEDELQDLGGADFDEDGQAVGGGLDTTPTARDSNTSSNSLKKNGKRKRRWTGFK